eukprot:s338_g20.t1
MDKRWEAKEGEPKGPISREEEERSPVAFLHILATLGVEDDVWNFTRDHADRGWHKTFLKAKDMSPETGWLSENGELCLRACCSSRRAMVQTPGRRLANYVGLKNHGATCYMNCLLQTLFCLGHFRHIAYSIEVPETDQQAVVSSDDISDTLGFDDDRPALPLLVSLQNLFYRLQTSDHAGPQGAVSCRELMRSFGWDTADAFMQHDAQELNRLLCDRLEEQMKGTPTDGEIKRLFEGEFENYIEWVFPRATMPLSIHVHLLSGRTVSVEAELDDSVNALRHRAESSLAVGRGHLVDSSGVTLDGAFTLHEAKLQSGDWLMLQVSKTQISAAHGAFAAIFGDGSVVTWGDRKAAALKNELANVQQIRASDDAFAAILGDGSVVTWGDAGSGGDSSAVQHQLKNVQHIQSCSSAFAAILGDGSVVTWGHKFWGGDSSAVQDQLKNVQQIQATYTAFAAILRDGSVVNWGNSYTLGDVILLQDELHSVRQLQATNEAFAAVRSDGSVITWGLAGYGGDSSFVQDRLKGVVHIQASIRAFAALLADASVVTWGDAFRGGDSSAVEDQLKNVQQIQASDNAFAAILGDGSVVTWGDADCGGDVCAVQHQLNNVQQIQSSASSFAAILDDESVVTWGDAADGGDSSTVQDKLKNVRQIQATDYAFAALLGDGSVVTWGDSKFGGDSSAVHHQLKNVLQIQSSPTAFAAILGDGWVVTWGDAASGGDSTAVQDQLNPQPDCPER